VGFPAFPFLLFFIQESPLKKNVSNVSGLKVLLPYRKEGPYRGVPPGLIHLIHGVPSIPLLIIFYPRKSPKKECIKCIRAEGTFAI
jgi:hypothetical protein